MAVDDTDLTDYEHEERRRILYDQLGGTGTRQEQNQSQGSGTQRNDGSGSQPPHDPYSGTQNHPNSEGNNGGLTGGSRTQPTSQGGTWISRDEALRRVQEAYQQYLPGQMGEVNSAVDEVINRATGYSGYTLDRAISDLVGTLQRRAGNTPGGGSGSQYTSGSQAGAGDAALSQFMQYLQQQQAARDAERAQMRQILMSQLGELQQPVSADAPGIREVIAGQRLRLQRGAERQRQDAAELRAYDGSGGVGGKAFTTDARRIQERSAEADAMLTGDVLNREHARRAEQLTRLLSLAMQLGDTGAAQNIQQQLAALQAQLGQGQFYDDMAYRYAALVAALNADAARAPWQV